MKLLVLLLLIGSFAEAQVVQYSFGGASQQSAVLTTSAGQNYAAITAFGVLGYWVEVDESQNPVKRLPIPTESQFQVRFQSNHAVIQFQEPSSQVQVSLYTTSGKKVRSLWSGNIASQNQSLQIDLENLGTPPYVFVVQTNNARRSYQFIPQTK